MKGGTEMKLKLYEYKGKTFQFAENDVPQGAVEVKEKPAKAPSRRKKAKE